MHLRTFTFGGRDAGFWRGLPALAQNVIGEPW